VYTPTTSLVVWDHTCSVTCHPTQVNASRLTPASKLVLDLPTPEGRKAELTSWLVTYRDGAPARRLSSIHFKYCIKLKIKLRYILCLLYLKLAKYSQIFTFLTGTFSIFLQNETLNELKICSGATTRLLTYRDN